MKIIHFVIACHLQILNHDFHFVPFVHDREGVIASGAADDAIHLFLESKEDSVFGHVPLVVLNDVCWKCSLYS